MLPLKKTKSYRDWLAQKLADHQRAARYVTTAAEDSEVMFLKALRKVAEAQRAQGLDPGLTSRGENAGRADTPTSIETRPGVGTIADAAN